MAITKHEPLPHDMTYMSGGQPVLEIGMFSYISGLSTMTVDDRARIKIGRFSSIAWDVTLLLRTNHHLEWFTTYPIEAFPWGNPTPKPDDPHANKPDFITIGSDVWIGKGVTIMPGVTIGDGAVIASDAVVVKDVRPYAIVAGNPGTEKRRRFDDETVDFLLKAKWWTLPIGTIMQLAPALCSGDLDLLKKSLMLFGGIIP